MCGLDLAKARFKNLLIVSSQSVPYGDLQVTYINTDSYRNIPRREIEARKEKNAGGVGGMGDSPTGTLAKRPEGARGCAKINF